MGFTLFRRYGPEIFYPSVSILDSRVVCLSGNDPLNLNAQLLIWYGSEEHVVRSTEIGPKMSCNAFVLRNCIYSIFTGNMTMRLAPAVCFISMRGPR